MAMEYDGKTYRNLQEQVAYLTRKWQELANEIDELRAQIPSKMIVEELPEEGDPLITYYVGPKGTEPNYYYEVWVWVQEEPDGPFVWRELEDTDQVDLSGYLPIQTGATTEKQVYTKNTDGTQAMTDVAQSVVAGAIPLRGSSGQILVPTGTPTSDNAATSKGYVVGNFIAKETSTTPYAKVYIKKADGTQGTLSMDSSAMQGFIATRTINGQLNLPNSAQYTPNDDQAISKRFANGAYLAKNTAVTTNYQAYCKANDGTQKMLDCIASSTAYAKIPLYVGSGNLIIGEPTASNHAASKAYVDAAVGQLLYLHDIEIIVTVDATNNLFIRAYLINGSSTAISSIDRPTFSRMDVQYGAFGPNIANVTTCAVTKCPDGIRQDEFDEPYPAYLYQYMSGGSLVSGATTYAMSVTVTDSVITF